MRQQTSTKRAVAWIVAAGTCSSLASAAAGFLSPLGSNTNAADTRSSSSSTGKTESNSNPLEFTKNAAALCRRGDESSKGVLWRPLACSAINSDASRNNRDIVASADENLRLRQTAADKYYAKHKELPRPSVMHAVLPVNYNPDESNSILVIGDVHGCMRELQALIEKAVAEHNGGRPFSYVILVGDLCNKGPQSAEVVRWARTTPNVWSVRGNHDNGALEAALGDPERRSKKKYQWARLGEQELIDPTMSNTRTVLSDEDVTFLAELPYTLTIPGSYLGQEDDTLIVHAGLIPKLPLEDQIISTMVTMREVLPICDDKKSSSGTVTRFEYHERQKGKNPAQESADGGPICNVPMPWALAWKGPQHVIFGHDAQRGFQRYPGDHAIGLDTGAVYGRQLTAIILPTKTIVSIPSFDEYSPP